MPPETPLQPICPADDVALQQQVSERTGELERALAQARMFASELDHSVEAERRLLARELHDQFGQVATALRMVVTSLNHDGAAVPEATVHEMVQLIDQAIGMARHISATLRPPMLDDLGLAAAVEHFAADLQRQGGLKIYCDIADDDALSAHQANQLFRIVQAATTLAVQHARATELRIQAFAEEGEYRLQLLDNGRGPEAVPVDATGLRNMGERAQLMGATLHFGPGQMTGQTTGQKQGKTASQTTGARVTVQVPINTGVIET